jgi:hypothetical protein
MRAVLFFLAILLPSFGVAKDIVEVPLLDSARMVLQSDETAEQLVYSLQIRRDGVSPVEFWKKTAQKSPGRPVGWARVVDVLETDGKITALMQVDIGSYLLLQGGSDSKLESELFIGSSYLAMAENSGGGKIKLKTPTEIVVTSALSPAPVSASVLPNGSLQADGKPLDSSDRVLTVASGANQPAEAPRLGGESSAASAGDATSASGSPVKSSQSDAPGIGTTGQNSPQPYIPWVAGGVVALVGIVLLLRLMKR